MSVPSMEMTSFVNGGGIEVVIVPPNDDDFLEKEA
jgi:hypothetical protein